MVIIIVQGVSGSDSTKTSSTILTTLSMSVSKSPCFHITSICSYVIYLLSVAVIIKPNRQGPTRAPPFYPLGKIFLVTEPLRMLVKRLKLCYRKGDRGAGLNKWLNGFALASEIHFYLDC